MNAFGNVRRVSRLSWQPTPANKRHLASPPAAFRAAYGAVFSAPPLVHSQGYMGALQGPQYAAPALLVRMVEANTIVEHAGNIVVLGDVAEGSQVHAGGDVIVWGRLNGSVSAGRNGDRSAVILAQQMSAHQLSIADVTADAPHSLDALPASYPEVAVLDEATGQILLHPASRLSMAANHAAATAAAAGSVSAAGRASLITGLYISAVGAALLAAPKWCFGLLFKSGWDLWVSAGWIRVGGVLSLLFGFYYLGAWYGEVHRVGLGGFYLATIAGRIFLAAAFSVLVLTGQVGPGLLLLAAMNLVSAWAMARAVARGA